MKNNTLAQPVKGNTMDVVQKLATEENVNSIAEILKILREKLGDQVLSKKMKDQLQQELGVDSDTANGWNKMADVLKYIDLCDLAKNNPEIFNRLGRFVKTVLCVIFPIAAPFISLIPESASSKVLEWTAFFTPEHILHLIAINQADKTHERERENESIINEQFSTTDSERLLIVVHHNEEAFEQLRSLVEADDDGDSVVGTTDNSVKVVSWTDKMWKTHFTDSRLSNAKLLFIGKEMDIEENSVKFEKFGVSYGWTENVAFLCTDEKALDYDEHYRQFTKELKDLPLPEKIKNKEKISTKTKTLSTVAASLLLGPIGTVSTLVGAKAIDKKTLTQQMLLYGIINLYNLDLESFMNS